MNADVYFGPVADELERRARVLRTRALKLDPRNRDRQRVKAAKLERAARLIRAEGLAELEDYIG